MKEDTSHATNQSKPALASGIFSISNDLKVYRLGFGAMRITGAGIWGMPKDKQAAITLLKEVIDLGINFIDTADAYGPYISEELIAEALYPYPKGLVIATKGGLERPGPNQWTSNGNPKYLREACHASLKRLKLDQIDLYQLHRIDEKYPFEDQIAVFVELQREGKIRHIGLSEVNVPTIKKVQQLARVATVQNRYNLIDRKSEAVLTFCEEEKIGFIPWYPLQVGELAKTNTVLQGIGNQFNATPAQIALAWLLKKSPVMLPIPGTSSVQHLHENVQSVYLKLDNNIMSELDMMKN